MRDIVLLIIILIGLGSAFYRPIFGIMTWTWLNFMSPHRLSWGFLMNLPVVQGIAAVTLLVTLITKDKAKFYWNNLAILLILFALQISLTTLLAMNGEGAFKEWDRFMKTMVFIIFLIILTNSQEKITKVVWVIALSFAFYGIKGGIFSALTGGAHRVWGPVGTFIEDNNNLGLALLMTVPLMVFLMGELKKKWQKYAMLGGITACLIAVVMTYSRGSLVALLAIGAIFVLRTRHRFKAMIAAAILGVIAIPFIPEAWFERMNTLQQYEEDASAMGRINSWYFAFHLANDKPLTGGGAGVFTPAIFISTSYAPNPEDYHDAHSIYFEILAEQGWLGFALFMGLFLAAAFKAQKLKKISLEQNNRSFAVLCDCIWYSLFAYGAAGAFLGLGYFDYPYTLIALLIIIERTLMTDNKQNQQSQAQKA